LSQLGIIAANCFAARIGSAVNNNEPTPCAPLEGAKSLRPTPLKAAIFAGRDA
jgi:hypothetical protein